MKFSFRDYHLFEILRTFEGATHRLPLDRFLSGYFREHKAIGSKDRSVISNTLYDLIRWRGLLDHLSPRPLNWENRLSVFREQPFKHLSSNAHIPLHIRHSFPKNLFYYLCSALGENQARSFAEVCNTPAPTTIRVNPAKMSRSALLELWAPIYDISSTPESELGINFKKRINFFGLNEFKEGLFEIQDEASQLVAELVDAQPGNHVLDYCAGAGGKSLAFAHKMAQKGQIYLHDNRASILQEAKKRLCRADVQNVQFINVDDPKKRALKGKMDWVLVDAPCSGSGTLRRNPDMKWKFSLETLARLVEQQQQIFEEALSFLKKGGKIVYATCSVLPKENQDQVTFFQEKFSLIAEKTYHGLPQINGKDGMFAAVLSKM